jgi:hypothetical protein
VIRLSNYALFFFAFFFGLRLFKTSTTIPATTTAITPAKTNRIGSTACSSGSAVAAGDTLGRGIGVGQGVGVGLGVRVGLGVLVGFGVVLIVVSAHSLISSAGRIVSLCRTQLATVERVHSNSNSSEQ